MILVFAYVVTHETSNDIEDKEEDKTADGEVSVDKIPEDDPKLKITMDKILSG